MRMRVILCDRNRDLCDAWIKQFCPSYYIEVVHGTIDQFVSPGIDAWVSPANSFGFMDGGIDLVYSELLGWDIQENLQRKIKARFAGELPVGAALTVETLKKWPRYVISAPTMRVPALLAGTINVYLAFKAALYEAQKQDFNTIVCPGLGTGVGQLPYDVCAKQMRQAYEDYRLKFFPHTIQQAKVANAEIYLGGV